MKTKALMAVMAIASLLLLGGSAFAEPEAIDNVPAATLLLPYFEVDLDNPGGTTTLFSVNNASAAPTIAHITIWSDLTVPVLDWNVFLTGYDVHSVNLRDVLNGSLLPETAHATNDPADTISPHGANPEWDSVAGVDFPLCDGFLPLGDPALTPTLIDYVQDALTGQAANPFGAPGSTCYGTDRGNNVAIGYVTIDNNSDCNVLFPNSSTYWTEGFPIDENQLWGDYFIVDPANAFASGDSLVSVEAFPGRYTGLPVYTFYGRYLPTPWSGTDNREPLATTWATRYLNGGAFSGGTDLLVWRDSKTDVGTFTCGTLPSPFPLNEEQVVAFSEEEDAEELCFIFGGGIVSPPTDPNDPVCFPYETQRVSVANAPLAPSYDFGWMFLNLDTTVPGEPFSGETQNHVTTLHSASGLYQVGYQAVPLANAADGPGPIISGVSGGGN